MKVFFPINRRRENGLVLIIALIVLVAMSLAGVALMRSVDTSNVIAGNLGFKMGTLPDADIVFEKAVKELGANGAYADKPLEKKPGAPYFPSLLPFSQTAPVDGLAINSKGIPYVLLNVSKYDELYSGLKVEDPETKHVRRYVIERMCNDTLFATTSNCSPNGRVRSGGGTQRNEEVFEFTPLFRITVRVDGPRNTVTFTQTIVRMS